MARKKDMLCVFQSVLPLVLLAPTCLRWTKCLLAMLPLDLIRMVLEQLGLPRFPQCSRAQTQGVNWCPECTEVYNKRQQAILRIRLEAWALQDRQREEERERERELERVREREREAESQRAKFVDESTLVSKVKPFKAGRRHKKQQQFRDGRVHRGELGVKLKRHPPVIRYGRSGNSKARKPRGEVPIEDVELSEVSAVSDDYRGYTPEWWEYNSCLDYEPSYDSDDSWDI